jgi:ParB family transcriptional regulator, chromosome partitioning protein
MTKALPAQRVELIPIDRITVVNPRIRNKRVFKEIVDNIAKVGLKRPITVSRRAEAGGPYYDLVCGQGRLEAYRALGQEQVPALVVTADPEDCRDRLASRHRGDAAARAFCSRHCPAHGSDE